MTSIQKRLVLSLILIIVATIAIAFGLNARQPNSVADQSAQVITLNPTVIANLTTMPQATPLAAEDAEKFLTLKAQIETCEDYDDKRREQMLQHIAWLIDPSTVPQDMTILLDTNPQASLIFGMAGFTSIQWRILDRPAESCLVDIGRDLNVLLEAYGRNPVTIYDETE